MGQTPPRYAIYFVPERDSTLERLGSSLLGRDIHTGAALSQPELEGIGMSELFSLTRKARQYGLHATLKPPFFLKPGFSEADLTAAAERFAAAKRPIPLPGLCLTRMSSFFALAMWPRTEEEAEETENVRLLAREVVSFFDAFRAPPSDEELDRRRRKGLSPRQEKYLCRWGYPYVFDEFRFHVTLTDAVRDHDMVPLLERELGRHLARALKGNSLDGICLCRSDAEGSFTVLRRTAFSGGLSSSLTAPRSVPA